MESKLILFRSEQRFIDAAIYIRNYDDRFGKIADDAQNEHCHTNDDFPSFMLNYFRTHGYDCNLVDYEIIDD